MVAGEKDVPELWATGIGHSNLLINKEPENQVDKHHEKRSGSKPKNLAPQ
jgi:hypothetical protein